MDRKSTLADEVLVVRCQLGDERAFERVVAQYGRKLRYYVRRLIGRSLLEDDILQSIWLAVWVQLPKLRRTESFRPWLYRIARNTALQAIRRRIETAPLEGDPPAPDEADATFTPEQAAAVHAALDQLNAAHKEVLVLRFLEGMSYEEIADVIGCSLGTVRSRIYYGKKRLRETMEANPDGQ